MRTGTVALAVLLVVPARLAGQAPGAAPPQPPVFGVAVDMVALDASVVDADGRPVLGLGPEDFTVEVDGRPRRLVSVEYVGRDLEPPAPPPDGRQGRCGATDRGRCLKRVKVVITFAPSMNAYVVKVPELAGCSARGKSIDEALANVKAAIRDNLDIERKEGRLDIQEELNSREERETFTGEISV